MSEKDALEYYVKHGEKEVKKLTKEEKKAVSNYGYNNLSAETNGYLRGETDKWESWQENDIKANIAILDQAIGKMTTDDDLVLYRGVGKDYLGLDFSHPEKLIGKTVTEGGYMSTSGSIEAAEVYGRGVVLELQVPKGTNAAYVDLVQSTGKELLDYYKTDKDAGNIEYLLARGGQLKFTGYSKEKDANGKEYVKMKVEFELPQQIQKGQFAPDAWDAKKKKAAVYYEHKKDADKVLRKELDGLWDNLTEDEKYAVWEYTANSNPINKRLSGYGDTRDWSRKDFVGFGNSVWGLEDTWRYLPRDMEKFGKDGHSLYHKAITKLTTAIEKSKLDRDMWFKRQGGAGDFAGMMEGGGFKFEQVFKMLDGNHSQADLDKAFVGQRGKNNAFTSVGIAKDARWTGNIWYNIYAPNGTMGIYAEPQSHYGDSMGGRDKIYKKGSGYTSVGNEAEVIMQRGTEYRILAIRQKFDGFGDPEYEVDMEIVAQPDYFQYGDEDTYNSGKTRHKK